MPKITKIRKRDGTIEILNTEKIKKILERIIPESKKGKIKRIIQEITETLDKYYSEELLPSTQDIEDLVLDFLKKEKIPLKKYLEEKTKQKYGFKVIHGVRDDIGLSANAIKLLARRYLLRNEQGRIIETPSRMFRRIAKAISLAERNYKKDIRKAEEQFYNVMSKLEFLPNSPTLMNAGTEIGQLSACFVLPIEDSLDSIFDTIKLMAKIQQTGGGTGFNFSKIRPLGDLITTTKGMASGPLSFMQIFDKVTNIIKRGGKRRGANMAILRSDHPDIVSFIKSKKQEENLLNFNISVGVTDEFMDAAIQNAPYWLVNPRTGKKVKKVSAKILLEMISETAWRIGDPGIVFLDEINKHNTLPSLEKIESTNPCGEQPLLPYESCNLGSINLIKMIEQGRLNWDKLKKTVQIAVHFLDNVIDVNKYPLREIEEKTKQNRKIGLGIMGFADAIALLGIPYDSEKSIQFAEKLMKFITETARKKSEGLGKERGNFPNFEKSIFNKKYKNMRNATLTTIAPTGSISIIAGCSSGIEPLFAIAYVREILDSTKMVEMSKTFEDIAKKKGFYSKKLMLQIAKEGTVSKNKKIPSDVRKLFTTSLEIKPEWHVKIQSAFQKYVDNAVSKTVNLPNNAASKDIEKIYKLAYKLKCKGITVYRYGSKEKQILYLGSCPANVC
ncbi:adenosylcobalamin-dependent ribonucleoside-diphosphate reductase [Candidatus Woesearchaeota archaeon]|nr:adenosylcobalamin-dependent ribonucleoside-diphosphate reductase [Candidatus Woesearchaeota archaeon]